MQAAAGPPQLLIAPARWVVGVLAANPGCPINWRIQLTANPSPRRLRPCVPARHARRSFQTVRYTRSCCAAMVLDLGAAAAAAVREFFGSRRSRAGVAGGPLRELVCQPPSGGDSSQSHGGHCGAAAAAAEEDDDAAAADGNHGVFSIVAVSTDAFGQSITGLRATHRPSAQDRRRSTEVGWPLPPDIDMNTPHAVHAAVSGWDLPTTWDAWSSCHVNVEETAGL
jgi:hypothetical protein